MTAVETTKERSWEAEVHRAAGEIALMSREPDAVKAEGHFERALAVARAQQAKTALAAKRPAASIDLAAARSEFLKLMTGAWQPDGDTHDRRGPAVRH